MHDALEILCRDFGISIKNDYVTDEVIKELKRKREEEKKAKELVDRWHNIELQRVCDEIQDNRKCLSIFEKQSNFDVLKVLYAEREKREYYFDVLVNADEQQKINLYLEAQNDR